MKIFEICGNLFEDFETYLKGDPEQGIQGEENWHPKPKYHIITPEEANLNVNKLRDGITNKNWIAGTNNTAIARWWNTLDNADQVHRRLFQIVHNTDVPDRRLLFTTRQLNEFRYIRLRTALDNTMGPEGEPTGARKSFLIRFDWEDLSEKEQNDAEKFIRFMQVYKYRHVRQGAPGDHEQHSPLKDIMDSNYPARTITTDRLEMNHREDDPHWTDRLDQRIPNRVADKLLNHLIRTINEQIDNRFLEFWNNLPFNERFTINYNEKIRIYYKDYNMEERYSLMGRKLREPVSGINTEGQRVPTLQFKTMVDSDAINEPWGTDGNPDSTLYHFDIAPGEIIIK